MCQTSRSRRFRRYSVYLLFACALRAQSTNTDAAGLWSRAAPPQLLYCFTGTEVQILTQQGCGLAQPLPNLSSLLQASGEAVYTSDIREVLAFIIYLPVQKYLLTSTKVQILPFRYARGARAVRRSHQYPLYSHYWCKSTNTDKYSVYSGKRAVRRIYQHECRGGGAVSPRSRGSSCRAR
jgi:hypothetical protein